MGANEKLAAALHPRDPDAQLAAIEAAATTLGVELTPWQLDVARRVLAGETFVMTARRSGVTTVRRVVNEARRSTS